MTLLTIQEEDLGIPGQGRRFRSPTGLDVLPRLTTTVPREYVHRASHAEVFLTGCEQLDEHTFALTGQWPRAHTFFTSVDGTQHDSMQAAETIRQAGLFLAHAELGVPLGHHFLLWDLNVTTYQQNMAIGSGPSDLTLRATCTDVVRKGKRLAEFRMEISVERDGRLCAVGGGRFACISDLTYRRLRGAAGSATRTTRTRPLAKVLPAVVGKALPRDVVLSPTEEAHSWLLDPDPQHPILFDHGGDHFPGMVLLEAARQAAGALCHPAALTPASVCTDFHQYAEFTSPVRIQAAALPSRAADWASVQVTGTQGGRSVFSALISGPLDRPGAGSAAPARPRP
ncbi:ScbA/BarX family gamma-butyrolactone biosynthesis protein [Streptomyces sp. cmx-4-9]|uniref:ScbA/BarX family gamma-butyrolactone biosynthesis protein n=1 Tax=Streptomyces sp. cmx-4-9 TaxID=2790941 RepID=UPI003981931C